MLAFETILEDIYYKSTLKRLDFWMFELPIVTYINYKMFKMKVYKHHLFAIYINLIFCTIYEITSLIVYINNCDNNVNEESNNVFYKYNKYKYFIPIGIIFYLLIMIPRAYSLCQIKNFMDLKYISPYKILIIYGILGTIISTIIGILSTFIKCKKSSINMNICQIKDEKNKEYYFFENIYLYYKTQTNFKDIFLEIMTLIFGIITNFFYMFYYILVIKYFSPMHIIFFNLTYRFGFHVVDIIFILFINKNNSRNDNNSGTLPIIITCFGYINIILVWFGLLVYLEMIVLNFCKFNYNLRENIINRSIK